MSDTEAKAAHNELDIQTGYINKMRQINDAYFAKYGSKRSACVQTFGCQMNAHDSEKLEGMLHEMGYEKTGDEKAADVILYNTCCVRENAENKVFGNLGYLKHLKESRPDMTIILCGCMTQQDIVIEKLMRSYPQVDIVFGTFNLYKLPELLYTRIETGGRVIDVWKEHGEIVEDLPSIRQYKHKASVNIMYGCNNFCTYCIVPYVRGCERSRPPADILDEVKRLAEDGVKEVTLLGQNVNSYAPDSGMTFAELLRAVNEVDGIERIRFMTSHPKDLSDELIYAVRDCAKVAKHIHLPMQSGSTDILNKMNRHYTKDDYLRLVEKIRSAVPGVFLTTDIITGFPGETEEDFLDTLDVVRQARFAGAFTFIYSKRSGTPAAMMEGHISQEVINARFQRLVELLNSIALEINEAEIGQTCKVLAEECNDGMLSGRADSNSIVHFAGAPELIGEMVSVKITGCKTFYLTGQM